MPGDEMFDFTKEVDEVVKRLTSRHKIDCERTTDEKGREILEFKVSYGKYKIICDNENQRFYIYCKENYSKDGYEYMGSSPRSNGVFFKTSIW